MRRPWRWRWLVAALGLCAIGTGIAWRVATIEPELVPASPQAPATSTSPASATTVGSATTPSAPEPAPTFAVVFDSAPAGATLALDGVVVGVTPYTLRLSSQRDIEARLVLAGYVPVEQKLALDHEQYVLVPLLVAPPTVMAPASVTPAPQPAAHPKHPRSKPTDPFQRFD